MGVFSPDTNHNVRIHDYNLLKTLLDSITDLAQSRLLDITSNKKRLVDVMPREVSRHRAHSTAALASTLAA